MKLLLAMWESSGLLTKILIIWAFGPALGVYMFLGYKETFKAEVKAEAKHEMMSWVEPWRIRRDAKILALESNTIDMKDDLKIIKQDIKELLKRK